MQRRAYAPVVGAESGITRAQGDARDGQYANDPLSHADVYTAMECASAVLAALFQRERTGRGERIDVAMAQTMLYVNEHVHDHLWDGPVHPDWIRSFQPGDYPVLTAADGATVVIAGHPAERGTFDRFVLGMGRADLLSDPRFADVPSRLANFPRSAPPHAGVGGHDCPIRRRSSTPSPNRAWPPARCAPCARSATPTGRRPRHVTVAVSDRGGGTVRIPNAPWRFAGSDVSLRGEPRYRGEDNHAVLAELLGLDDTELDRLDETGVLSSRVPTDS